MNDQDIFSSSQVLRILSIRKERLRQWIKLGYVSPTVEPFGKRTRHVYTKVQLFGIALFKRLIDLGLNRWISSRLGFYWDLSDWAAILNGHNGLMIVRGTGDRTEPRSLDSIKIMRTDHFPMSFENEEEVILIVNLQQLAVRIEKQIGLMKAK